jgi:hypothetical protein
MALMALFGRRVHACNEKTVVKEMDLTEILVKLRIALASEYYGKESVASHNLLIEFTDSIRSLTTSAQKREFITSNYQNLVSVKQILQQFVDQKFKHIPDKKKQIIRFRDIIFGRYLRELEDVIQKNRVTDVFNEFVKGITSFDEIGENQHTVEEIKTCFIERLIYDAIWLEMYRTQQNDGHLKWLEDTRNAYLSCFPDYTISIEMQFNNASNLNRECVPTHLIIHIFDEKGVNIQTDTYIKSYNSTTKSYDYPVICEKIENKSRFTKLTDFKNRGVWMKHR